MTKTMKMSRGGGKTLSYLLAAAVLAGFASSSVYADTVEVNGRTWTYTILSGTKVKLTAVSDKTTSLNAAYIPWTFTKDDTTYTVTQISGFGKDSAGKSTAFTGTLSIPDAVTGVGTFESCTKITGLSIGKSVGSLPNYFMKNANVLTGTVIVPASVASIGQQAFTYTKLKAMWIKGRPTVSSGTQNNTTVSVSNTIVANTNNKRSFELLLLGPNSKPSGTSGTVLDQYMTANATRCDVFVPNNRNWKASLFGGSKTTVSFYGPGADLNLIVDENAKTITEAVATQSKLDIVLGQVANFKSKFGLDSVIAFTNSVATTKTITEAMLQNTTLEFKYLNAETAPVLAASTVSATSPVKVRVTASDGVKPDDSARVLTSGGAFTGKTVELADGSAKWAKSVFVNGDGNLQVKVRTGLMIVVL